MDVESSLAIIAICSLVLTLFLIVLILYLIRLLCGLNRGISSVRLKAALLLEDAHDFVHITREAAIDIKDKIKLANPLFSAVAKINAIECVLNSQNSEKESPQKISFLDAAEWAALTVILWHKLKKRG
jgi:uncharacterized protein YoxC